MFKPKAPHSAKSPQSSWLSLANLKISQLPQRPRAYQYNSLPSRYHIRYLVLEPGRGQEPLMCNLYIAALTERPSFEAISYVWGSNKKVAKVSCAGQTIRITANLRDVLRRVRLPNSQRALWADSICIDQENMEERGDQVALMGQIYRQANRTLICLGPDNGQGHDVASLVADINQRINYQQEEFGSWDHVPSLDQEDPIAQDQRWGCLKNMIVCPWFSRVWVVQEAALATEARILYGPTELAWRDLIQVKVWLILKAKLIWFKYRLFLNDIHHQDFWTTRTEQTKLVGALARAKGLGCADPRDRVYAFLGSPNAQVGPDNRLILEPDYSKHYHYIYHDLAEQWLRQTRDLSLLSAVDHTDETFKSDIPSWVPRWDCVVANDQLGLHNLRFNASRGASQAGLSFTSKASLRVRGFIVDSVHFRSEVLPGAIPMALVALWGHLPGSGQNVLYAFWRRLPLRIQNLSFALSGLISDQNNVFGTIWKYISEPTTKSAYNDGERLIAFARTLRTEAQDENHSAFTADEASFGLQLCRESSCFNGVNMTALEKVAQGGDDGAFKSHAMVWYVNRRFIFTDAGYYGLAPQITQEGDVCCIINSLRVPVILRKTEKEHYYKLVGEAFILGLMEGQAIENAEKWGLKEQDIILC
ncbi:HET domain-containing protein [Hyaloscypha finlandica]|nr:HET domain-containing protein [Hyaloscypha finlandica]